MPCGRQLPTDTRDHGAEWNANENDYSLINGGLAPVVNGFLGESVIERRTS